jgi:superfamily I DNA/RNA helicase
MPLDPASEKAARIANALNGLGHIKTIDFDDAASMARLKEHARQALEAFIGETLPEKLPE